MLDHAAALLRTHLAPLLAQFLAPFRRHLPKPVERFAYPLLLFRRQALELLPALAQLLPLLRRHGAPLSETLLRARPLLGRHRQPALTALGQRLLALRGQAIPLALIAMQQLLLLRRHRRPCLGSRGLPAAVPPEPRMWARGAVGACATALAAASSRLAQTNQGPDHYFASCGGVAGGFPPRGGTLLQELPPSCITHIIRAQELDEIIVGRARRRRLARRLG